MPPSGLERSILDNECKSKVGYEQDISQQKLECVRVYIIYIVIPQVISVSLVIRQSLLEFGRLAVLGPFRVNIMFQMLVGYIWKE